MDKRTLLGILLFVSLGFNLFALGFMVGKPPVHEPKSRGPHFEMMAESAKQLPPDEQEKVMAIIQKHKPEIKSGFKDMMETRKDVDALMKSDAYNREEAELLFAKMSDAASVSYRTAQKMMMDIADVLPPESRAMMMPKPQERKWDRGDKHPPRHERD